MTSKLAVASGALFVIILSGLIVALPPANAQSSVSVSIPKGADVGPTAAPGFAPANITVILGINNTVVWTNNDASGHSVTSTSIPTGAAAFDSGLLPAGKTFTVTFTVPGTYEYRCVYHSWMQGSVIVEASTSPTPEFPAAYLAVTFLAVIAVAILVATSGVGSRSHAARHDRW